MARRGPTRRSESTLDVYRCEMIPPDGIAFGRRIEVTNLIASSLSEAVKLVEHRFPGYHVESCYVLNYDQPVIIDVKVIEHAVDEDGCVII